MGLMRACVPEGFPLPHPTPPSPSLSSAPHPPQLPCTPQHSAPRPCQPFFIPPTTHTRTMHTHYAHIHTHTRTVNTHTPYTDRSSPQRQPHHHQPPHHRRHPPPPRSSWSWRTRTSRACTRTATRRRRTRSTCSTPWAPCWTQPTGLTGGGGGVRHSAKGEENVRGRGLRWGGGRLGEAPLGRVTLVWEGLLSITPTSPYSPPTPAPIATQLRPQHLHAALCDHAACVLCGHVVCAGARGVR